MLRSLSLSSFVGAVWICIFSTIPCSIWGPFLLPLVCIRTLALSLSLCQKSHFQRKRIFFNSLTLKSVYACGLLFEMAVSFGDASRCVRIYTYKQRHIEHKWEIVLIRILPISTGGFYHICRCCRWWWRHKQTKTILIHVEISSRHIILVWCFISILRWIGGPSIDACLWVCVCVCVCERLQGSLSKRR